MPSSKKKFSPSRAIEKEFERALKKIARASAKIVEKHIKGSEVINAKAMTKELKAYSEALTPWAQQKALQVLGASWKKLSSESAYRNASRRLGEGLQKELLESEIGAVVRALQIEMVELTQSIPIIAGTRAQELALEALTNAGRASEIATELMRTPDVTENRAKLIARTEVARTNLALNMARATLAGSNKYIWRTSGDASVRHSHRKMNGKTYSWDNPPELDDGTVGHPGSFPNCRCYAEPILPKE